jgi:two-component sensor histidine kinase/ligand-binding sensor domain-containing protein
MKRLLFFTFYYYIVNALCFAQSLSIKHFTNNEGLSLSENQTLFQDSRGFIWIGSNGAGVDVYNGKTFTNHNKDNGLHDIIIDAIHEDNQGNLWFGSPRGLCMYDGLNFTIKNSINLLSQKVTQIIKSNSNDLWALTENGIITIHQSQINQLRLSNQVYLKGKYLDACIVDKKRMMLASENKLTLLNTDNNNLRIEAEINIDFIVTKILNYDNDNLIIASNDGGIYLYNLTSNTIKLMISIQQNDVKYFSLTTLKKWNNQFLAGTNGNGVYLISNKFNEIKPFKILDTKQNNLIIISDILVDFNNNLWISTIGEGLIYLKSSKINSYSEGMASSSDIFYLSKKNDYIIAASHEFGIFSIDKNGVEKVLLKKQKLSDYVGVKSLGNDGVFGFIDNNLYKYNEISNSMENTNLVISNEKYTILDLLIGSNNKKYIISTIGIHDFTNPKNCIQLYKNRNSNEKIIIASAVDSKSNIWFSDSETNYILKNNNELNIFDKMSDRCGPSVLSFMEDNLGNMWLLTNQCLAKYDGKNIEFIENKQLYNKMYYSGLFSKLNNTIWLGTNDGVVELTLDRNAKIIQNDLIDSKAGFNAKECNQSAIFEEETGKKIWFGTIKGIVGINKNRYTSDTTMPKLGIIDLRILLDQNEITLRSTGKSKWFNIPENLELPYNKNHIAIGFTGIQYINPEKIKYRYKLIGFDTAYCEPTSYNYASYTNLPPGAYTLEVIANNSIGQWTKEPLKFNFTVERPYWKTWWFYTFMSLGILTISSIYYYYRKRQVVILEKRLEEEVSKRTYELKKQNDKIETLIKEIHHRVKNNLQVITSLINLHSGFVTDAKALEVFEESKNRIKSMALVHEKLYETNDLSSINVDDFIIKMFDYLRDIYDDTRSSVLEKNITVDKLDIDTVIPLGLLINEIFTNAFKYALKGNNNKVLTVSLFQLKSRLYELKIRDTGKGFNYEMKRNSKSSFGLELVDLLVSQLNGKISVDSSCNTEYTILFESIGKIAEA